MTEPTTSTSDDAELERALSSVSGEGEAGQSIRRLSWEEYRGSRNIFRSLLDIRGFTLLLDLAPLPELARQDTASRVATDMYGIALNAIEQAGFFQQDVLTIKSEPGSAAVIYGDDRYDFGIQAAYLPEEGGRQGQLAITRTGSRFADFHAWYVGMAPHFPDLVRGIMQLLREETHRRVEAFRGSIQFRFLLYDLRAGDAQTAIRNTDLMRKLVRGVPNDDGDLSEDKGVMESAGRIDVALSRWVDVNGSLIRERYSVEAPANKEGAGLWLQFSHNAETYTLGERRVRFDLEGFLRLFGSSYVQFLRDKALDRFLVGLLGDTVFRTATDTLP